MQTWYWRLGTHYSDRSDWSSRCSISDDGLCARVSGYGNAEGCGRELQRAGFLTATIFNITMDIQNKANRVLRQPLSYIIQNDFKMSQ